MCVSGCDGEWVDALRACVEWRLVADVFEACFHELLVSDTVRLHLERFKYEW